MSYQGDVTQYVQTAAARVAANSYRVRTLDRPRKYAAVMAGIVQWVQDPDQASSFSRQEARETYQRANAAGMCVTVEAVV